MRHLFAVIGLGRFGYSVAETLVQKGCEVLAIDLEEAKIQSISDIATFAVQCDATDERALKVVSTQNVDVAVVSIGETIEASIGDGQIKTRSLTLWERQLVIRHAQAHAVDCLTRLSRPQLIWRGYLLKRKWDRSWTR